MTNFPSQRLKFLSSEPLKYGANAAAEHDNPDWPRFVRITDVGENGQLRDDTFRSLPPEMANGYLLKDGDILLARSGATVGKSFIYDPTWGKACYAGYLIKFRTSEQNCARYIY
jgi:type I restriction enzyme, S subunit